MYQKELTLSFHLATTAARCFLKALKRLLTTKLTTFNFTTSNFHLTYFFVLFLPFYFDLQPPAWIIPFLKLLKTSQFFSLISDSLLGSPLHFKIILTPSALASRLYPLTSHASGLFLSVFNFRHLTCSFLTSFHPYSFKVYHLFFLLPHSVFNISNFIIFASEFQHFISCFIRFSFLVCFHIPTYRFQVHWFPLVTTLNNKFGPLFVCSVKLKVMKYGVRSRRA